MPWAWRRHRRKRIARIAMEGPITGATRKRVHKALQQVEQQEFPTLLLRI